jgi:predicted dehydrogenase
LDAVLHYAEGLDVRVRGGWYPSGTPFSMGFQIDRAHGTMRLKDGSLQIRQPRIGERREAGDDDATGGWEPAQVASGDGYVNEIAYFVDCCRRGQTPDRCSPADSARAVRLALLLKQARLEAQRLPAAAPNQ